MSDLQENNQPYVFTESYNDMSYNAQAWPPPYQYNIYAPKPFMNPSKNWAAVTGLILGITLILFSIILGLTDLVYGMGFLCAILGVVFSSIGMGSERKKIAVAGLITSLSWFFLPLIYIFVLIIYFFVANLVF